MTLKLSAGLVIFFIALVLQFWFAQAGVSLNLSFAALISLAFIFGFWELIVLVLLGVFIMNWQPAASVEILIFALYPIAAHFSRGIFHWQAWIEPLIAVLVGFFILYLAAAPAAFHLPQFLLDVAAGLIFSAIVFFPLHRWGR